MSEPATLSARAPVRLQHVAVTVVGTACCIAAMAAGGATRGLAADVDVASASEYVEEVIVTADRLEKGAVPSQTIIVQTYSVLGRRKRLYNERRYAEALPYLEIAAKRGFKWAQAMAGTSTSMVAATWPAMSKKAPSGT